MPSTKPELRMRLDPEVHELLMAQAHAQGRSAANLAAHLLRLAVVPQAPRSPPPPVDNAHVAPGCERFGEP